MDRRCRITLEIVWAPKREATEVGEFEAPDKWHWPSILHTTDPYSPTLQVRVVEYTDIPAGP